jgi:Zn-dependent protease with chaperone function
LDEAYIEYVPDGLKLDVKVYMNPFLYIFTRSNNAIRVNSGVVEALTDNQLLFLMAHEIAHLKNKDYGLLPFSKKEAFYLIVNNCSSK